MRIPFITRPGKGISLLVPFKSDSDRRAKTWEWLARYWKNELPGAQVIVASDDSVPFNKTSAVNRAWRQAKGDIIVILDADCLIPGSIVEDCARQIRVAKKKGGKTWYVPYRHFYRLTDPASALVLASDPVHPLRLSDPPPDADIAKSMAVASSYGHQFGALIQIMPREAFAAAGGMDERFNQGWGGEDQSFMNAVDTLWAKHMTTPNGVLHLWHPGLGTEHFARQWAGQTAPQANDALTTRYAEARGHRKRMGRLTREPGAGDFTGGS